VPARKRSGKGAPKQDVPDHYKAPLLGYMIAAINPVYLVRVELNGAIFYDTEEEDATKLAKYKQNFAEHLAFQGGESTQTTQPLLQDLENTTTLPFFKQTSILWLKNINLNDYGNTFPTVQVVVRSQQKYPSIGALLRGVIDYSGINQKSMTDFGFNALSVNLRVNKIPFYGAAFMLDGGTPLSWLQPFVEAWNLRTITRDGITTIDTILPFDEVTFSSVQINESDLLGLDGAPGYEVKVLGSESAPSQLALSYIDIDSESTPQVSYASLNRSNNTSNITSFDIKSIMPKFLADTLCERMLRNFWAKNKILTFVLPITSFKLVSNGDLVSFTEDDILQGVKWLVVSTSFGDKGFLEYSCVEFNPSHYAYSSFNTSITALGNSVVNETTLSQVRFEMLDIPALKDSDFNRLTPYYALSLNNFNAPVYLYQSTNNINYEYLELINKQNYFGVLETGITELLNPELLYENTSIEVSFDNLDFYLLSVSHTNWIKGSQLFLYKQNLYSYKTATFIGSTTDNLWRITGLIAGFRGTGASLFPLLTSNSDKDIIFIKNSDNSIQPNSLSIPLSANYSGVYYSKLGVSVNDDISNNISIDKDYYHNKAKAAAVQILPAKVFTSGVIQLRWITRSTEDNAFTLMDGVTQPLTVRDGASFLITIFDKLTFAIIRTVTVSNVNLWNYTVAMQQTDNTNFVDLRYKIVQQSNKDLLGAAISTIPYDVQVI
jgi:hypothetical protein